MKVLFVGSLSVGQTSLMRMEILRELGHEVFPLSTQLYWDNAGFLTRRLQQAAGFGPIVERINSELLDAVMRLRPDVVWAEKQEFFKAEVLKDISSIGVTYALYPRSVFFIVMEADKAIKCVLAYL